MLVFDASSSMAGNGWGYGSESPTTISRIDKVRSALTKVLPSVTRFRHVGLISYGPGPYNQCNVHLNLKPLGVVRPFWIRPPPTFSQRQDAQTRRRCSHPWMSTRIMLGISSIKEV
jgi:hypothetical protein